MVKSAVSSVVRIVCPVALLYVALASFCRAETPLAGYWVEETVLPSDPLQTQAEYVIDSLEFKDGRFNVLWAPWCVGYVDFWGTYSYDARTETIRLELKGGNQMPVDFDGEGRCVLDDRGRLILKNVWFGAPPGAHKTRLPEIVFVPFKAFDWSAEEHNWRKVPPIVVAIKQGDSERARKLIARGADPNPRYKEDPLKIALSMGLEGVCMDLVSAGAGVSPDYDGRNTLLRDAVRLGNYSLVTNMVAHGASVHGKLMTYNLFQAICVGNTDLVSYLIDNGAVLDSESARPINAAIWNHRNELVRTLVENGVQLDARWETRPGERAPVILAAQCGNMEALEFLVASGAKTEVGQDEGFTTAMEFYSDEGYEFLKARGCATSRNRSPVFGKGIDLARVPGMWRFHGGNSERLTFSRDGRLTGTVRRAQLEGTWHLHENGDFLVLSFRHNNFPVKARALVDGSELVILTSNPYGFDDGCWSFTKDAGATDSMP